MAPVLLSARRPEGRGLALAAVVVAVALSAGASPAQPPKLYFGEIVTKSEAAEKALAAAEKAEAKAIKDDKAPAFENPPAAKPAPEAVAAAAALSKFGVGDAVLSAALLNPPRTRPAGALPHDYHWVKVQRREVFLLDLGEKKVAEAAAKARTDGKLFVHPDYKVVLTSRQAGQGPAEYYFLVQVPAEPALVTEDEFQDVRALDRKVFLRMNTVGAKRLAELTKAAKPDSGRFAVLVAEERALFLAALSREIKDGLITLSASDEFRLDELKDIETIIKRLLPPVSE